MPYQYHLPKSLIITRFVVVIEGKIALFKRETGRIGNRRCQNHPDTAKPSERRQIGFFHHDPQRTDDQIDSLVSEAKRKIEAENRRLECFAVKEGQTLEL